VSRSVETGDCGEWTQETMPGDSVKSVGMIRFVGMPTLTFTTPATPTKSAVSRRHEDECSDELWRLRWVWGCA